MGHEGFPEVLPPGHVHEDGFDQPGNGKHVKVEGGNDLDVVAADATLDRVQDAYCQLRKCACH